MEKCVVLSSGDASDSICPKGWGMAGLSGDGSYEKLIIGIYKSKTNAIKLSYKENDRNIYINEIMKQSPISFMHSGYYLQEDGSYGNRGGGGNYREKTVRSDTEANRLYTSSSLISPGGVDDKNLGASLRFVAK